MDNSELVNILRGLLISNPKITKANRLEIDFQETEGRPFPYRKLGFSSFVDYLQSIPTVVKLVPSNSHNPEVHPIAKKESSHIDKLISKQKVTAPRKNNSIFSRRGGYHGGFSRPSLPMPPRRRPCAISELPSSAQTPPLHNKVPSSFGQDFIRKVLWKLVKEVANSKNGIHVKDLENTFKETYGEENLSRNGIHSANDLLCYAGEMVKRFGDRVYPNISYQGSYSQDSNLHKLNGVPTTFEERFETNELNFEDSNFWESVPEDEISNFTIRHCTQSNDFQGNGNMLTSETKAEEEEEEVMDPTNHEIDFSKVMINNFRTILEKYPDGIWATELPQKYLEHFGVTLDLYDLGYSSPIMMASFLPDVFTYKRAGPHDWKLYDARKVKQVECVKPEFEEDDCKSFSSNERYIPKSILENIKLLVEKHREGFKSIALLSLYETTFNKTLDLKTLGFNKFEDFLEILSSVITVRKTKGYYLLMPKHVEVPQEKSKSNTPVEVLKLPEESYLGPDNVLKPNDIIPCQELPPVNLNAQFDEPLIEMEVRVADVISPSMFYFVLDSNYNALQNMMEDLEKFYKQEESNYQIPRPYLMIGLICACLYDGVWHRAKITGLRKNDIIDIEYIDYGTTAKVNKFDLRLLQNDFALLPSQSICAKLLGIQPKNNTKKWPTEVSEEFLKMVTEKRLLAHVYCVGATSKDRMQLEVILFDTNSQKEIILNEYLVERGLAEFVNKVEDEIEKQQAKNEDNTSASNHSSFDLIPQGETKRTSRPPPGFETQMVASHIPNQDQYLPPTYPLQMKSQMSHSNFMVGFPIFQQALQVNNVYPNFQYQDNRPFVLPHNFVAQTNQYVIPSQPFGNTPQGIHNYQPCNWWQTNVPRQQPPPPVSQPYFYPPNSNNFCQNNTYYQKQNNISNSNFNLHNTNNIYNTQSFNETLPKIKIPDQKSDLTLPKPVRQQGKILNNSNPQEYSSALVHPEDMIPLSKTLVELLDVQQSTATPQISPVSSVTASYPCETNKQIHISLTDTSTVSSPVCNKNNEKSFLFNYKLDKELSEETLKQKISYEVTSENSIGSPISGSFHARSISSTSDEYASATETIDDTRKSVTANSCIKDVMSLVHCNKETLEEIPDSWEDIDVDETPSKAENFSECFKNPIDFLNEINNDTPLKDDMTTASKMSEIKIENLLFSTGKILAPTVNWKDVFDPDASNKSAGCTETITNKKSTSSSKYNVKKVLVQKLEIDNKFFHLIYVKNELAVLAYEFYRQFTPYNLSTISRIIEAKYEPFPVINKKDEPELFSKLDNIEFCGGVSKKVVLKLGKASISYLSDIPNVLSVLNLKEPKLLDELKIISYEFNSY